MEQKKEESRAKAIIYTIIIGFAVIAFWRGVWGLLDIYIFPNNLELSLWTTTFLGIIILISTHHLIKELKK
ncbi:hypothetical protein HOE04_02920 [archaeon]|jgi:hypothetical protein|nr:hypothetical protein [archaeon]